MSEPYEYEVEAWREISEHKRRHRAFDDCGEPLWPDEPKEEKESEEEEEE